MTDIKLSGLTDPAAMLAIAYRPGMRATRAFSPPAPNRLATRSAGQAPSCDHSHACPSLPLTPSRDCLETLYENWRSVPPLRFIDP
ncbi:hypothetical protein [uncultured Cohaesibacter sp.]|uniref:hypothetical protein n=1 Tax=uncultured Cohaesibacter sp. TaxID=1002546 RepID=UPI0029309FFD|nr:hypothetical protein [uncultured Cohaesibacter sp.]